MSHELNIPPFTDCTTIDVPIFRSYFLIDVKSSQEVVSSLQFLNKGRLNKRFIIIKRIYFVKDLPFKRTIQIREEGLY